MNLKAIIGGFSVLAVSIVSFGLSTQLEARVASRVSRPAHSISRLAAEYRTPEVRNIMRQLRQEAAHGRLKIARADTQTMVNKVKSIVEEMGAQVQYNPEVQEFLTDLEAKVDALAREMESNPYSWAPEGRSQDLMDAYFQDFARDARDNDCSLSAHSRVSTAAYSAANGENSIENLRAEVGESIRNYFGMKEFFGITDQEGTAQYKEALSGMLDVNHSQQPAVWQGLGVLLDNMVTIMGAQVQNYYEASNMINQEQIKNLRLCTVMNAVAAIGKAKGWSQSQIQRTGMQISQECQPFLGMGASGDMTSSQLAQCAL